MKIGLVLSGGSARGIMHLGVLKALNEIGVHIDAISGVSAGSIVGAFHLAGYSPEDTLKLIVENKFYTWTKFLWRKAGLLDMGKVEKMLGSYLPVNFEDLKGEFHVSATDIKTGETAWFNSGQLVKPVCGSSAIPVVFDPVRYNDYLLLDGGIVNNFATEPLVGNCDKIIGVHVNHVGEDHDGIGMRDVMDRVIHFAIGSAVSQKKKQCAVFIEPPNMTRFNPLSLSQSDELFKLGYTFTMNMRKDIEAILL